MSTISNIIAPPDRPHAKPSIFQHVKFQNSKNCNKSVSKKTGGISLKPPSTTLDDKKANMNSLDKISQVLKRSSNQETNNKRSILHGLNIKVEKVSCDSCRCTRTVITKEPNLFYNDFILRAVQ